jgi:predicted TIM-barrel fold metal-dependent hydrolase
MDVLDPELPIIDAHHHLWDLAPLLPHMPATTHAFAQIVSRSPGYLFDELHGDCRGGGHNVIGTVFLQCDAFYRAEGPEEMKPVGEVEFANGVAAQSASGIYGPFRACAAIVGHADLSRGARVGSVLDAEIAAGNGRFRGVRHIGAHDADPGVLGPLAHAPPGLYGTARFREGFAELGKRGLTFDAWVLAPQIGEVTALARAFPEQPIVLDHVGTPLGLGVYKGRQSEGFGAWKAAIAELAACPNVVVKLGGLAMPFCALGDLGLDMRPDAETLAALFRPYLEACIEAFGAHRAMFESNFPVDRWGADYATLWNAFKLIARGAGAEEKRDLFARTAARFYSIEGLLA